MGRGTGLPQTQERVSGVLVPAGGNGEAKRRSKTSPIQRKHPHPRSPGGTAIVIDLVLGSTCPRKINQQTAGKGRVFRNRKCAGSGIIRDP